MGRIAVSDGGRVVWNLLSVTGGRNALLPEEPRMIRHLLHVDFQPGRGLQEQVRETLVNAILSGIFAADTRCPPVASWPASFASRVTPARWCSKVWSTRAT